MKNKTKICCKVILFILYISIHFPFVSYAKKAVPVQGEKFKKDGIAESLSKKSTRAQELFQRGLEYSRSGKVDLAIQEYNKALEFDPNLSMAHINLGMSYIQKKEFEPAIKELQKAVSQEPTMKLAHFNLWWAYRQQHKYDQGIEELKKIIAMDPNEINAYKNLGDTYLSDKKMMTEAISTYSRGLKRAPQDLILHQKIGKVYELNKQWDKAIYHFEQAINLKTNDPYNYLFLYITLKKSNKHDKAKTTMEKAISAIKEDNTLALVYPPETTRILEYLLGTFQEKELLSSQNPFILCQANYYIGMNYLFEKDFKKATQHFQQSLDTGIHFASEYEYAKIELERIKLDTPLDIKIK